MVQRYSDLEYLLTTEDIPRGEELLTAKTNMMVKTYLHLHEDQHCVDDLLIDLPGGEDLLTAKDLRNNDDDVNLPGGVGPEVLASVLDLFPPPVELGE